MFLPKFSHHKSNKVLNRKEKKRTCCYIIVMFYLLMTAQSLIRSSVYISGLKIQHINWYKAVPGTG